MDFDEFKDELIIGSIKKIDVEILDEEQIQNFINI